MHVIRSLLFYCVFYGGSVLFVLAAIAALRSPARLRRIGDSWSQFHRSCATGLLGMQVAIEGEHVGGPALYVIKHESFFEAIDMACLFKRPVPFGKQELFGIPGWGQAAKTYGAIEVARDRGATALRAMIKAAKLRAAEGRPLVLFPEGTRVPHGGQPPLKSGFAALYKMLGVPVVPVAVDSGPLYQRWWKRSGTITYRFAEPVPPGLPREDVEARVHAAINALNSAETPD